MRYINTPIINRKIPSCLCDLRTDAGPNTIFQFSLNRKHSQDAQMGHGGLGYPSLTICRPRISVDYLPHSRHCYKCHCRGNNLGPRPSQWCVLIKENVKTQEALYHGLKAGEGVDTHSELWQCKWWPSVRKSMLLFFTEHPSFSHSRTQSLHIHHVKDDEQRTRP